MSHSLFLALHNIFIHICKSKGLCTYPKYITEFHLQTLLLRFVKCQEIMKLVKELQIIQSIILPCKQIKALERKRHQSQSSMCTRFPQAIREKELDEYEANSQEKPVLFRVLFSSLTPCIQSKFFVLKKQHGNTYRGVNFSEFKFKKSKCKKKYYKVLSDNHEQCISDYKILCHLLKMTK